MWDILGNRAAVVLISVTCGCVLIYNAWGAILVLAFSLLLVLYVCYSLLANDSLVSPHAYYVLVYLREAILELCAALDTAVGHGTEQLRKLWHSTSRCYRERFPFRMDRRRGSKCYQLSSDSYAAIRPPKNSSSLSPLSPSSGFSLIEQLSPIPRDAYRLCDNDTLATYDKYCGDHDRSQQQQQFVFSKYTSTPVFRPGRGDSRNGDVGQLPTRGITSKRIANAQSHTLSRGENIRQFTMDGSPWGTSISPKMRPRPAGVKTVQTIAGPLLASTRYNIDPKIYTDVSSPGLTTRLTKYATEARNKLTHQPQYGTGQFPKVNLSVSPIPLLNTKSTKLKMPVTVKLAPPEVAVRYSPPERQRLLSNIRHAASTSTNKSATSVVQVLKEISLKRHASREDISFDVAKKQRTESLFNEERDMVLEETKQKRSRDDSSKSEEDLSPQNKSVRPAKRTKTQSCYDILNSLSSSVHASTGVKRKAIDFSRSGTPDFEKHFKSLKSAQPSTSSILPQSQNLVISPSKPEFKEINSRSPESSDKAQKSSQIKGILRTSNQESKINLNKPAPKNIKSVETDDTKSVSTKSVKLVDKLFMRAEPERNDRLKLLVEEQGNIKAKFTKDNVEEIKREDIRNMRQTSMKARLKSMFDAISGKAESRINPDVVIQADDVNVLNILNVTAATCSVSCATLSSSTTTTNVNTTPITTAAIIPSGLPPVAKVDTKVATTFSLPNITAPPAQLSMPIMGTPKMKETNVIATTNKTIDETKIVSIAPVITSTESLQKVSSIPTTASHLPCFTFGKPVTETVTSPPIVTPSSLPRFGTSTSSSSIVTPIVTTATSLSTTNTNFLGTDKTLSNSIFIPISTSNDKIESSNAVTSATASLPTIANTLASSTFMFGNNKLSSSPATCAQISAPSLLSQSIGTVSSPVSTNVTNANFNNVAISTSNNIAITTSAPVQASLFTFGGSSTASQTPKSDLFMFGQSGNVQSTNAFANASTSQPTSLPQAANKSFGFTSNTSTAASSSFGVNATATPAFGLSTVSTFSLGTSTTTTSATSTSKPLFVFGANSGSTTVTAVTTAGTNNTGNTAVFGTMNNNAAPATMFGAPTTTTPQFRTPTATAPQFGTPTTTAPQFGTPTTTAPQFGTPATTSASQFGASTTTVPQFGTSIVPITSIFAATPNVTTTSIFGTTNSQPVFGAATSTPGATNIFNSPKTTAASIFVGMTNASSSDNPASSGLFSNANINTNSTTASSVFGSSTSAIFGQAKPTTSFGSGASMFGSTSAPLFGSTQTTTAPTFGIANASAGNTMTPAFNAASNATPAFGAPSAATAANVQNTASTPAFGGTTGGSLFGSGTESTSVPAFGTNVTAVGAFPSSTTNTFGQNSAGFAFGAGTTSSGAATFGDGKSPFGATPATTTGGFGTSLPAFGTGNANNNTSNNTSNIFFGSNPPKDGQQNATFSFTSSTFNAGSNNSTTVSSAPFQFGATAKPAATGFNFTAPSATPTINFGATGAPTFNPSTPGMFSIGSGSTAPRSRTIRTRKPR